MTKHILENEVSKDIKPYGVGSSANPSLTRIKQLAAWIVRSEYVCLVGFVVIGVDLANSVDLSFRETSSTILSWPAC